MSFSLLQEVLFKKYCDSARKVMLSFQQNSNSTFFSLMSSGLIPSVICEVTCLTTWVFSELLQFPLTQITTSHHHPNQQSRLIKDEIIYFFICCKKIKFEVKELKLWREGQRKISL